MTRVDPVAEDLHRQLEHWLSAAHVFLDAEEFASSAAWRSLEHLTGTPIRAELDRTVRDLLREGSIAAGAVRAAMAEPARRRDAHILVQGFRRNYLKVETTLDFFGQAVNSRSSRPLQTVMQTLDRLAYQSLEVTLRPLGIVVPPVLTYIGEGLGASIIRAGIRLWAPGSTNPVAAIKIVRHNLYRPTSLFHETGHQVAHLTGWTDTLATALGQTLADDPPLRAMWQPWASEIAADVYAFVLTGYASVAALYDVVADDKTIMRWPLGDPHPIGWLRTLLGCGMCRHVYGAGPWDDLEAAMLAAHPETAAEATTAPLLLRSKARIAQLADTCLTTPVPGLRDRPITALVDPGRVAPAALAELERQAGPALFISPRWRETEGLRIVALTGLREAERPDRTAEWAARARSWMTGTPSAA